MQKSKLKIVFCAVCDSLKESRFCNKCQKETLSLYKEKLVINAKGNLSVKTGIKRGETSWAYFPIAYGILLTISIETIQTFEFLRWYWRIILLIILVIMWFYLCFFNGRFRNFIVNFLNKSKEMIERF